MSKKIIIADDHAIFRDTLSFLLANKTPHVISAQVDKISDIQPACHAETPDVLLMDYHMPGGDALAAVEYIKSRFDNLKVVFLTGTQSGFILKHLIDSPADGILHKTDDASEILATIEAVLAGQRVVSPTAQQKNAEDDLDLTQREFHVFSLVLKGLGSAEIGQLINIAPRTVDKHKENLMKKAKVSTTAQLMELGYRLQVFDVS